MNGFNRPQAFGIRLFGDRRIQVMAALIAAAIAILLSGAEAFAGRWG